MGAAPGRAEGLIGQGEEGLLGQGEEDLLGQGEEDLLGQGEEDLLGQGEEGLAEAGQVIRVTYGSDVACSGSDFSDSDSSDPEFSASEWPM
jgi:hypothetical protein